MTKWRSKHTNRIYKCAIWLRMCAQIVWNSHRHTKQMQKMRKRSKNWSKQLRLDLYQFPFLNFITTIRTYACHRYHIFVFKNKWIFCFYSVVCLFIEFHIVCAHLFIIFKFKSECWVAITIGRRTGSTKHMTNILRKKI